VSRPLDLVAVVDGKAARLPADTLGPAAREALAQLTGGAVLVEGRTVSGAVARDGRPVDIQGEAAHELARVLGSGYASDLALEPRPVPSRPERKDFADEVAYFRAAASRAATINAWGLTDE
jgi:hypothetical protein